MEREISGIMVYYYKVCERKLWYFTHEIQMEHENEDVIIGHLLDKETYKTDDKHVNINNVINIDFIRKEGVLHEIKKSRKIEEASILQVKYYLYYLHKKGVTDIIGKIDYPLLKKTMEVYLLQDDIEKIEHLVSEIRKLIQKECPPNVKKKSICKSCAYYDLCYI